VEKLQLLHLNLRKLRRELLMAVLSIEDTTIENGRIYVTALVEDMQLVALAHRDSPEEWVPGLCSTSFELADDESIPITEDGFCSYLDRLDPQWELIDTSDYQLT
jgi:hypothetical protein